MKVEAAAKKNMRSTDFGGTLLCSKGFVWLPNMHDFRNIYSHAGSMVQLEGGDTVWTVLQSNAWKDSTTDEEKQALRMNWEGPYGDCRQELVFIGIDLKPKKLQAVLDTCLMTKEEFAMGVDGWKAIFGDMFLD